MLLYHLDLKYSMYRPKYLRELFKRLRRNGYDGIVVEIDNKLVFPSHPEFASRDALSPEEWYGLVRDIKQLGMIVYPLIQTLGHMQHVLYPKSPYSHLAEMPGERYLMCASKPASVEFIKDLIRDVYVVFDRPRRIHLGGDECRGLGSCPRCIGKKPHEIMGPYLRVLSDYANRIGMKPEFWADMFLSYPHMLREFPRDCRLVDWNYRRTARYTDTVQNLWGQFDLEGESASDARQKLSDELRVLEPFIFSREGKFDNLYSIDVLGNHGFEVMLASAARSGGDTYFLPKTITHVDNVGFTQSLCEPMGCDHLVTSWAVRLNHPETTWPALLSKRYHQSEQMGEVSAPLGGLEQSMVEDIENASSGIWGIDMLDEVVSRFENRSYGALARNIRDLHLSDDRAKQVEMLQRRVESSNRLISVLEGNLGAKNGDAQAISHWILGLKIGRLKAEQTLGILDTYAGSAPLASLSRFIEENTQLSEEFTRLWQQSVTPGSLGREVDVKFGRDIKTIQELIAE